MIITDQVANIHITKTCSN